MKTNEQSSTPQSPVDEEKAFAEYLREHPEEQGAEQRRMKELVRNARENDRLGRRIEELTLYLLGTSSLDDLIENLPRRLRKIFDLEYVALKLDDEPGSDLFADEVADAQCGATLTTPQIEWLFGEDSEEIRSLALVPLKPPKAPRRFAMLAFGSSERTRYQSESGTHYLKQLQRLVSASIAQLSTLAAN